LDELALPGICDDIAKSLKEFKDNLQMKSFVKDIGVRPNFA
jgi:hypothetical protein